ncbi:hypothetical protein QTP70_005577 [Hemibagrus guttatus]|uniref:Uncharacterized protein n=1 Tax=Hemibagrus guttatus TaxID=175788 RepID=A0AAE0RI99_9TELE|nr:hypothetical protein QTP70_005577 [Hemibagrus guttatus]
MQVGAADPALGRDQTFFAESDFCSRAHKSEGRLPAETGAEARGVAAPVESVWRVYGQPEVDLFASEESTHCLLWYSLCHTAPLGLDALVKTWLRLHLYAFPLVALLAQVLARVRHDGVHLFLVAPRLASLSLVRGPCLPSRRHSLGDSHQGKSPLSGARGNSPPPPGDMEALGVAPEGDQFLEAGLSSEVVETLLNARAPSTRKLYALKWRLFSLWCSHREQDPVHCPIGTVLGFLQSCLSRGLSPSTLKVYVATIAANHALVLGATLGRHPLVYHFLRGARRLRPSCRPRLPSVVLDGLLEAPFEHMESASEKFLALASLRWVGDLQALSVAPTCLEFAPGWSPGHPAGLLPWHTGW